MQHKEIITRNIKPLDRKMEVLKNIFQLVLIKKEILTLID